ncbi:preprotein translocase subunit SecE [Pseudomonas sp. F1_0610]|uniref:preprotein translocase subunit SecE n=1 Tax=Pseudomonas sp. F1_0610 TaxID=3114284 RepID=UPI0039C30D6C
MKANVETQEPRADGLKWSVVVLLAIAAVVGNYYFSSEPVIFRAIAIVVIALVAGFVVLQTAKGRKFAQFAKESRAEIRKVVWPSRQETIQTTLIVVVFVMVMALILWALDSLFGWLISIIVG